MFLILQVTSAQSSAMGAAASHTFGPGGGSIGRRADNDWVLTGDPYVSSKHALISAQGADFYITDNSSNGTGFEARNRLLPKGQPVKLSEGSTVFIGDFEIRASFAADTPEAAHAFPAAGASLDPFAPGAQPDPFAAGGQADPFGAGSEPDPFTTGPHSLVTNTQTNVPPVEEIVPSDQSLDPLDLIGGTAEGPAIPEPGAMSNHNPAESDFFIPPSVIPEAGSQPQSQEPPGMGQPPEPAGMGQLPEDWDKTSFSSSSAPADPTPDFDATAGQIPPITEPPPPSAVPPAGQQPPPMQQPPQVQQPPPPPPAQQVPPPVQPGGGDMLAAAAGAVGIDISHVLRGAGIDPGQVSPEFAGELGQILRVVVDGMIEVLKARTEIKSQFRVPVTTIKPVENNPLKFSAGVDDALYNLLVKKGAGYLGPVDAFEEGFRDIKAHQMAVLAGMRAAFNYMLSRFDPAELESIFGGQMKRSSLMAVGNRIKYWESYKNYYRDISAEAEDNFQSLFGEEFAQAYEEQMQRLTSLARNNKQ